MNAETKNDLVKLAEAHQAADEYIEGQYGWDGGACAIGCTILDARNVGLLPKQTAPNDHHALEVLGVPELAWRLCDAVFEGLPDADRPAWTPKFLRAIRPDADYTNLPSRIMVRLAERLAADALSDDNRKCAELNASLYRRRAAGDEPLESEWDAASQQADAAWQQAYAARQQAYAAWHQADAASQQADAARQQADAAWQQADAAWQQAYAARQQADAARHPFWSWCGEMLLEELAQ